MVDDTFDRHTPSLCFQSLGIFFFVVRHNKVMQDVVERYCLGRAAMPQTDSTYAYSLWGSKVKCRGFNACSKQRFLAVNGAGAFEELYRQALNDLR